MNRIEQLCKRYTDLTDCEIEDIERCARSLPAIANLFDADAFIDCQIKDGRGDSIVVAEAKPISVESSYKKQVTGLIATKEKEPAVYRSFELGVPTKFMKAITQENVHVVQLVEPIFNKDRVIGVFIVEQKIERLVTEPRLMDGFDTDAYSDEEESGAGETSKNAYLEFEELNKTRIVDKIEEGVLFVDHNGLVSFRNRAASDIYKRMGFLGDILGKPYKDVCIVGDCDNEKDEVTVQEVRLGNYYFTVKTSDVDIPEVQFVVTINDITAQKMQEKELVLKSVAFKEMHHRVKNSLQTIAGLLRLQRNATEMPKVKQALTETISRILAISLTHQILLETEVSEVKMNDIVAMLKDNMLDYYDSDDFHLAIDSCGGDFDIKFEKANAVALILNELMQNSVKYAFTGRKSGHILILLFQRENNEVQITFTDNGKGFDIEKIHSGGMGWTIIQAMVGEKLEGKLDIASGPQGTRVNIRFHNK